MNSKKAYLFLFCLCLVSFLAYQFLSSKDEKRDLFSFVEFHEKPSSKEKFKTKKFPLKNEKQLKKFNKKNSRNIAQVRSAPYSREIRPRKIPQKPALEISFARNMDDIEFKNGFYRFDDIHAIKEGEPLPDEYELIEKKLGHVIIRTNFTPDNACSIVIPEGSQTMAVFTGILKIKFVNYDEGLDFVNRLNGYVSKEFDYINSILFQLDSYEDTISAYKTLKSHPDVENVDYELLQYARVPK